MRLCSLLWLGLSYSRVLHRRQDYVNPLRGSSLRSRVEVSDTGSDSVGSSVQAAFPWYFCHRKRVFVLSDVMNLN